MHHNDLYQRWQALGAAVAVPRETLDHWYQRAITAWSTPERFYHTLDHLASVLAWLDAAHEVPERVPLLLAAWFHDAVYEAKAHDNEERCAELGRQCALALGLATPQAEEVVRLILLTKTHCAAPDDVAGQWLLDADLAILGAPTAVYERYASAIRQEYAWVPEEQYRQGRSRVLQTFLDRPRIYQRPGAWERYEETARANLRHELGALGVVSSAG